MCYSLSMKNKIYIALLVVLVLCFGSYVTKSAPAPVAYEYKFEFNAREQKVNALASQGWELVAIDSGGSDIASVSTFVFKRAK